jgi:hypothetical protein
MGYVQKLRAEVEMVRQITLFLEKQEERERMRMENAQKVAKACQTSFSKQ